MSIERYFDNAATTPLAPEAKEAMLPWLAERFGNAHSLHEPGREAAHAVELARAQVAALVGCEPEELYFTSGATESNNWVLRGFQGIAIGPTEHSSVRETAIAVGALVTGMDGLQPADPPLAGIQLSSRMLVNNEIGSIYDPAPRPPAGLVHSDSTQALGKLPINLAPLDLASFSAHKLYGPKGVGCLYAKDAQSPPPLLTGGEHEGGRRAGTLNVPGIVGFGAAAQLAADRLERDYAHAENLRSIVLEELASVSDWQVNGGPRVSPYILSLSFFGIEGETLVIETDHAGFAISSGAACSSRSTEPSHVLIALRVPGEWLRGTVRISFGRFNTEESARELGAVIRTSLEKIRRIR